MSIRKIVLTFLTLSLVTGGIVSWFASEKPDGLEWSIEKVTGKGEVEGEKSGVHGVLAELQEKLAFLPDYSFKKPEAAVKQEVKPDVTGASHAVNDAKEEGSKLGTTVSGIIGGLITLAMAFTIGFFLKKRSSG
jgi:cobalt/nickel transport system permease protein